MIESIELLSIIKSFITLINHNCLVNKAISKTNSHTTSSAISQSLSPSIEQRLNLLVDQSLTLSTSYATGHPQVM